MNYETASEFELNKRLAELLGYIVTQREAVSQSLWVIYKNVNGSVFRLPDYCNSWADTGPVIEDLGITVDGNGMAHVVDGYDTYKYFTNCIGNPLRAAVIVAIQVLEERENNEEDQLK